MTATAQLFAAYRVGEPISVRNLTVTPLYATREGGPAYITLDEALAGKSAETTEINEAGSVPELRFRNDGQLPVFLLDGEELRGAKQNRVLNMSILADAKAETMIPVSCIEAGRWNFKSRAFQSSAHAHHSRGRAGKLRSVSDSLRMFGAARSDQSQVWSEIGRKQAAMMSASATSALSDTFDSYKDPIEEYVSGIDFPKDACGAAFAVNGATLGVEIFDRPETCSALIGKLIRSWALDALEAERAAPARNGVSLDELLARVSRAKGDRYEAAGLGDHVRFEDDKVVGGALEYEGVRLHTVAYARTYGEEATVY